MQPSTDPATRLDPHVEAVIDRMKTRRCFSWAEDIGHEVWLILYEGETRGIPVPECRGVLDAEVLKVADRIARSCCPGRTGVLDERTAFTRATREDDLLESSRGSRPGALSGEFSDHQIEAMTRVCASECKVTQGKLAEAAGVPLRTFKRSLRRVRATAARRE